VAIASAESMSGVKISYGTDQLTGTQCSIQGKVQLPTRPYYTHGYGRSDLSSALFFASSVNRYLHIPTLTSTNSAMFYDTTIATNQALSYSYCVWPNSTAMETRVVLVWTDPPSTLTAQTNLVNDLNLEVTYMGQTVAGNNQSTLLSTLHLTKDNINPVEVVYFDGIAAGQTKQTLTATVTATVNTGTTQLFTLIVSGYVSEGACQTSGATGPGVAPYFLPTSSANATTLPDRPAGQKAPYTLDPNGATAYFAALNNTSLYWYIAAGAGAIIVIGLIIYCALKMCRKQGDTLIKPVRRGPEGVGLLKEPGMEKP